MYLEGLFPALREGKKVCRASWADEEYIYLGRLADGLCVFDERGRLYDLTTDDFDHDDWKLYTEDKNVEIKELVWEILNWSIEHLPDNTEAMQRAKKDEELDEFTQADESHKFMEAIDVLITLIGLLRYDERMLNAVMYLLDYGKEEIEKGLRDKLLILLQREYKIINGVYHH